MPIDLGIMADDLVSVEVSVLRSNIHVLKALGCGNGSNCTKLAKCLIDGQYWSILDGPIASQIIGRELSDRQVTGEALYAHIQEQVTAYIQSESNSTEKTLECVLVGAAALNTFVQTNWTGPKHVVADTLDASSHEVDLYSLLPADCVDVTDADRADHMRTSEATASAASSGLVHGKVEYRTFDKTVRRCLGADGEEAYGLASYQHLLLIALAVLDTVCKQSKEGAPTSAHWWYSRAVFKQQQILSDWSATLRTSYFTCMQATLDSFIPSCSESIQPHLRVRALIEMANVSHYYQDQRAERACIIDARELAGVTLELTGALGRRTRWQQTDISQLVLRASGGLDDSNDFNEAIEEVGGVSKGEGAENDANEIVSVVINGEGTGDEVSNPALPKKLALNDDTLLEKIAFNEDSDAQEGEAGTEKSSLSVLTQCLLLASCLNVKNSNAKDGLTTEEMVPFVERLLKDLDKHNWQVYSMGLLLRSRLEGERNRTAERGAMQMQVLVDQFNDAAGQKEASPAVRMAHIYTIYYPSRFELEREIGIYYLRLGVVVSAREIFERLHMWEDVVDCYRASENMEKAVAMATELVELSATPRRLCLLGDVSNEPEHYQRAWDVSGGRYSKAMRALGRIHFAKGEFAECVECLQKAADINPLLEGVWFTMGAAAIRIGDWESGIKAYRHCVTLNDTNGESWNNLGTCYIRVEDFEKAMSAFKYAAKNSYDNWKVWENYFNVNLQLKLVNECIECMNRLLDLKGNKFTDVKAMQYTNDAVMAKIDGLGGTHEARTLSKRWQETLGRTQVGGMSQNVEIWNISAKWHTYCGNDEKVLDCLQRAYRSSQKPAWQESSELGSCVVTQALKIYDVYEAKGDAKGFHSALLMLRGLVKKTQDIELSDDLRPKLEAALEECQRRKEQARQ
ncbi:hypothetical protein SARC_03184 [Sphaeroforma arctica JP610]|uniref:Uncharacterized protein n=1 Tax=Sphaeroforma arctica JP610 TaxID=667725 RepID=A0A0L0G6J4_9EUKA|nr:hypothetical protein SARC_03184 [Sphaeroforma arctica JP610]KNC84617.1 hypothetical protein SARC_03184 [Sphaeroforma arctica JP610]|eukprot:XP_014158519.1 hypothetical protein SARC_03184 [Sphaeroforma arctica JP610]